MHLNGSQRRFHAFTVLSVFSLSLTTKFLQATTGASSPCLDELRQEFSYGLRIEAPEISDAARVNTDRSEVPPHEEASFLPTRKALHLQSHLNGNRFPQSAQAHVVLFDFFSRHPRSQDLARSRLSLLSSQDNNGSTVSLGVEAYSPQIQLQSPQAVAAWMKDILLDLQSHNTNRRPIVVMARGALAEGAAILSRESPDLVQMLVIENPRNGDDLASFPAWNAASFGVPTLFLTGTHNSQYPTQFRQQLLNLAREGNLPSENGNPPLHYVDAPFAAHDPFDSPARDFALRELFRFLDSHVLKQRVRGSAIDYYRLIEEQGVGTRRIVKMPRELEPDEIIEAMQRGLMPWESGLMPVRSVEEAFAHIERLRGHPTKAENENINAPLFFISDSPSAHLARQSRNLEEARSVLGENPLSIVSAAVASRAKFFWIEAGQVRYFEPQKIDGLRIETVFASEEGNNFMYNVSGWTLPNRRGIMELDKSIDTSAYRRARNLYHGSFSKEGKLVRLGLKHQGYQIVTNRDFPAVLKLLRETKRKGQSENATRFLDPNFILIMQRLWEGGLIETYELYGPQNPQQLLAASFVIKLGEVWSPETLGYVEGKIEGNLGFELGKTVLAEIVAAARRQGHSIIDAQIQSSTSSLFGSRYTDTETGFIQKLAQWNRQIRERSSLVAAAQAAREAAIRKAQALVDADSQTIVRELNELQTTFDQVKGRIRELEEQLRIEGQSRHLDELHGRRIQLGRIETKLQQQISKLNALQAEIFRRMVPGEDLTPEETLAFVEKQNDVSGNSGASPPTISVDEARKAVVSAQSKLSKSENLAERAAREAELAEQEAQEHESRGGDVYDSAKKAATAARIRADSIRASVDKNREALAKALATLNDLRK